MLFVRSRGGWGANGTSGTWASVPTRNPPDGAPYVWAGVGRRRAAGDTKSQPVRRTSNVPTDVQLHGRCAYRSCPATALPPLPPSAMGPNNYQSLLRAGTGARVPTVAGSRLAAAQCAAAVPRPGVGVEVTEPEHGSVHTLLGNSGTSRGRLLWVRGVFKGR